MKIKVIIFSVGLAVLAGVVYLLFSGEGTGTPDAFEAEKWEKMVENQLDRNLERYFAYGVLPEGQEKAFLIWIFQKDPKKASEYTRTYGQSIPNLPWYLSDASWDLIRQQDVETGLGMLRLARELFPNNPDVLGMAGVIAYLRGDRESARRFLEDAEQWKRNRPIVDFYLGGLLAQSDSAADRTRGKAILMQLVTGPDPDLSELAGLSLLSNINIPMIREDLELLYTTLDAQKVFRPKNPRLPAEALRLIINRYARQFPERAMAIADLLMQYELRNVEDVFGMVRLAQAMGKAEKSRLYLDELTGNPNLVSTMENPERLVPLQAAQAFLEEDYESGLEKLTAHVRSEALNPASIQETFQAIIRSKLPLSVEQQVLALYLDMPVYNIRFSMGVINRLMEIDPLDGDQWVGYAIGKLLKKDPVLVGGWLAEMDASKAVIAAVGNDFSVLGGDEAMILVNAHIAAGQPEEAQQVLDATRGLIDPVLAAFFQAKILVLQDRKKEALTYWQEAQQGTVGSNQFNMMKSLGLLAIDLDQPVSALQTLYAALSAGISFTQDQASQLIGLTMKYGSLQQTITVAWYLTRTYPESPVYANNLAYFQFLAGEDIEDSVQTMRRLTEDYPDMVQFRLTLALGLVKAGRTNEATRLLESTNIDWQKTSTRGLLIYVVVLGASGQSTLAQGLMQNLDMDILIPEEKALLESL